MILLFQPEDPICLFRRKSILPIWLVLSRKFGMIRMIDFIAYFNLFFSIVKLEKKPIERISTKAILLLCCSKFMEVLKCQSMLISKNGFRNFCKNLVKLRLKKHSGDKNSNQTWNYCICHPMAHVVDSTDANSNMKSDQCNRIYRESWEKNDVYCWLEGVSWRHWVIFLFFSEMVRLFYFWIQSWSGPMFLQCYLFANFLRIVVKIRQISVAAT